MKYKLNAINDQEGKQKRHHLNFLQEMSAWKNGTSGQVQYFFYFITAKTLQKFCITNDFICRRNFMYDYVLKISNGRCG